MHEFISYGRQYIDNDDVNEVVNALKSDFLTCGPYVEKFEQSLCNITGAKYAVVCNSGTSALHLAMLALGIGEADSVIVPTLTFLASANAARYCGGEVVFADVDPHRGLLTIETLEDIYYRAKGRVKAVIVVHLAGQLVDMPRIRDFCNQKEIFLVEDACHAIGGDGVGACKHSDMATFSFHPVKTIAMGEGGAITTNNKAYADTMRSLRSHGMIRGDHWKYTMPDLGYNYRASELQCALGYSQLKKLDMFTKRRREIARIYDDFFADIAWATPVIDPENKGAYHLYPILIDFDRIGKKREVFMDELKAKGIGTQVHYIPVHSQPYYGGSLSDLPGAASFYDRVLSLPIFYGLTPQKLTYICETLSAMDGV